MTVTKDQAQMLTTLACATRPTGARQFKHDKVMAEIATLKARGLSLGAIICAVTRCAMDRNVEREECITSPGSHWGDTRVGESFVPQTMDASQRCSVCSKSEPSCRITTPADDHVFESVAAAARRKAESTPAEVAGAIAALHDELRATPKRDPAPTGLDATEKPVLKARLDALIENNSGLASEPLQMTEETSA